MMRTKNKVSLILIALGRCTTMLFAMYYNGYLIIRI